MLWGAIRTLDCADVLCRRNGYTEAADWPVRRMLDKCIAIRAVDASNRLEIMNLAGSFLEELFHEDDGHSMRPLQRGMMEVFRVSMGEMAVR